MGLIFLNFPGEDTPNHLARKVDYSLLNMCPISIVVRSEHASCAPSNKYKATLCITMHLSVVQNEDQWCTMKPCTFEVVHIVGPTKLDGWKDTTKCITSIFLLLG